jgi:hypothetical protein
MAMTPSISRVKGKLETDKTNEKMGTKMGKTDIKLDSITETKTDKIKMKNRRRHKNDKKEKWT